MNSKNSVVRMRWKNPDVVLPHRELRNLRKEFKHEEFVEVIALVKGAKIPRCMKFDGVNFYDFDGFEWEVTHWMALPSKPDEWEVEENGRKNRKIIRKREEEGS